MKFKSLLVIASLVLAQANASTLALDPGHTPSSQGVTSACGNHEVNYNDEMVALLKVELEKEGHSVRLTRNRGEEVIREDRGNGTGRESAKSLRQRLINVGNTDVLVSIHHDSVAEKYLETVPNQCGGKPGTRFTKEFKDDPRVKIGFNVFISGSKSSKKLGVEIGTRLKAIGLTPSNYHGTIWEADQAATPIDEENGIWRKNLFITRESPMPAVLIEVYPIVDSRYEQRASSPEFRSSVARAIKEGVDAFLAK